MASTSGNSVDQIYGPVDDSVLHDQANHRCEDVMVHPDDYLLLRSRRADAHTFRTAYRRPPHHRVLQKLNKMGFYRIYKLSKLDNDLGLISALVERLRPETNTFHFRVGEATITLQDVAILWGLPVDGLPVVGYDECTNLEMHRDRIFRLLGFTTERHDFDGSKLKTERIVRHVTADDTQITDDSDEASVDRIARCWALLMIGVMCPDTSGDIVSCFWIKVLEDIPAIGTYSWGSAILANCYRHLTLAAQKGKKTIAGPLNLIQVWYITFEPMYQSTFQPTSEPTSEPMFQATFQPTSEPTFQPMSEPTFQPTSEPTFQPTSEPTFQPMFQDVYRPTFDWITPNDQYHEYGGTPYRGGSYDGSQGIVLPLDMLWGSSPSSQQPQRNVSPVPFSLEFDLNSIPPPEDDTEEEPPAPRRSQRTIHPPQCYTEQQRRRNN